MTYRKMFL